ncbi:MAG: Rieske 2Fe-2S domain-containing protein [Maritimibacter sp.]|nr:Rieske 2Fe-2S domain-containing protein [Maritimibacter sp.]
MADALSQPDPWIWRGRPRAPQPGTALGPLDEIAEGGAKEYVFGRGTTVFSMFVVRREGEAVFGYLNLCPHYSTPLNYRAGAFMNEAGTRIRCTMHFAEFRIEDGYGVSGAAERCWLDPVPVLVKDGTIHIATPEEFDAP